MHTIQQRRNECGLASVCVLNGLSQADYEAVSDIVRKKHPEYIKRPGPNIYKAIEIAKELGLTVPQGYFSHQRPYLFDLPQSSIPEKFKGKGIAWVKISPETHVIAYDNGRLIDSNRKEFESWEAYRMYYKSHHKRIKLIKVFPVS